MGAIALPLVPPTVEKEPFEKGVGTGGIFPLQFFFLQFLRIFLRRSSSPSPPLFPYRSLAGHTIPTIFSSASSIQIYFILIFFFCWYRIALKGKCTLTGVAEGGVIRTFPHFFNPPFNRTQYLYHFLNKNLVCTRCHEEQENMG